jgi:hypothetical protein
MARHDTARQTPPPNLYCLSVSPARGADKAQISAFNPSQAGLTAPDPVPNPNPPPGLSLFPGPQNAKIPPAKKKGMERRNVDRLGVRLNPPRPPNSVGALDDGSG